MKTPDISTLLASICIILSFFLGYVYALREWKIQKDKMSTQPIYIDITTSQKSIKIKNTPQNIFFRIDGELMQSGSIDLK